MKGNNIMDTCILPVEAEGITFYRGKRIILKEVSFKLSPGEFLGLVGPNGAGKTTLFRILLGLEKPHQGSVAIFGTVSRELKGRKSLIGYLPQKALIDPNFPASVFDVVKMGRAAGRGLLRLWKQEDNEAVEKILRRLHLIDICRRPIGELSGGQQQMVFLARALVNEPKLLLVDEPTTGLDFKAQQRFYSLMKELQTEQEIAMIIISHDIEYISGCADRLAYLNVTLRQVNTFEHAITDGLKPVDIRFMEG